MQKSNIIFSWTLIIIGLTLNMSCQDDDATGTPCDFNGLGDLFCVFYEQTACADPWGNGSNNNETIDIINSYFESKDVSLFGLQIEDNGPQAICNACHCKSGRIIWAQVERSKLAIVLGEGFVEKN